MLEELTTLDEVHYKVDSVGFLENVVHSDDERMVHLLKNHTLNFKAFYRLMFDDDVFSDALHSKEFSILLALNQVYFAKGSSADHMH